MKNKKNLKGFTLVELIVVMAVFGIIMLGAMQFLDPVGKMMKGASLQEANSATVDNIKRYFEGTLRYASSVYVHNGDLKEHDAEGNPALIEGGTEKERQTKAVQNFVDYYFMDRVGSNNEPITGKVHVMKIDNGNQGKITESLFDFTAGYTYEVWDRAANQPKKDSEDKIIREKKTNSVTIEDKNFDQPVINDVYYKDYSIFATLGYNTVNPVGAGDVSALPAKVTKDQYFGRINPVMIDDGTGTGNLVPYTFGSEMFSFTFVTYKNTNGTKQYHHIVDGQHLFGSPYSSSNATLALVNMKSGFCDAYNTSLNNRPVRYKDKLKPKKNPTDADEYYEPTDMVDEKTETGTADSDGKWDYESTVKPNSFTIYDPGNLKGGNNIYIIYTLPDGT